jgi:hypothetical protein
MLTISGTDRRRPRYCLVGISEEREIIERLRRAERLKN